MRNRTECTPGRRIPSVLVAAILLGTPVHAQGAPAAFSTASWCNDSGTICWGNPEKLKTFTGLRFIGEPNLGTIIQRGDNRFESGLLKGLIQAGVEINLIAGIVSLQGTLIPPGSIQLDANSPIVTSGRLSDPERRMKVDIGWGAGLTLFDGIIAVGRGRLYYDTRNITNVLPNEKSAGFFFINLQPLSAIRVLIKRSKPDESAR